MFLKKIHGPLFKKVIKKTEFKRKAKENSEKRIRQHLLELCEPGDFGLCSPPMNANIALQELADFFLDTHYDVLDASMDYITDVVYRIEEKTKLKANRIKTVEFKNQHEAIMELKDYFLGKGYYIVMPMPSEQCIAEFVFQIEIEYQGKQSKNYINNYINTLLIRCKAIPHSEPKEGGSFYKLMNQEFKLPNGEVLQREFLKKKEAAAVLPITTNGDIVCIIQPISLVKEGTLIEIPAGYAESSDRDSTETAMRELVEETGYIPEEIISLGKHYQDPGSIKEPVSLFLAIGCKKKSNQDLDKDEFIFTVEIPKKEIKKIMDNGVIKDANTFIALSKARFLNII